MAQIFEVVEIRRATWAVTYRSRTVNRVRDEYFDQTGTGANSTFTLFRLPYTGPCARGFRLSACTRFRNRLTTRPRSWGPRPTRIFHKNSNDYSAERSVSSLDMPHRVSAAVVYAVPGGNILWRNTEIRGIVTAQSGQPFTPYCDLTTAIPATPEVRSVPTGPMSCAIRVWSIQHRSVGSILRVRRACPYTFGSAGRNILRGPAFSTIDLSLARRFSLSEQASITFEAEAFNLLNHTNFHVPEAFADEPARFGSIFRRNRRVKSSWPCDFSSESELNLRIAQKAIH